MKPVINQILVDVVAFIFSFINKLKRFIRFSGTIPKTIEW